jgi:AraC-like DNA-binding protein
MDDPQSGLAATPRPVFSTEDVGPDRWRDVVCGAFPGVSIDWLDAQPNPAWLGTAAFDDARILEMASNRPTQVACARSPAAHDDTYDLALLLAGSCRCRHAGQDEVWGPGDLLLFDSTQPFDLVHPTDYHLWTWKLPREALAPMLAEPDHCVGRRIAGDAGPGAVLGNYLRALMAESAKLDATAQRSLLMHLYGLVGLTLGAGPAARESRRETHQAVRRQQILTYIETHLRNPCLSAQRAARDLRMSPRWLHALLEQGQISFAARVARRRLEECGKLLNDPAYDHMTIADIAFRSGFDNLSSFNRRFRVQYGMAPRDVRRRCASARSSAAGGP